MKVRYVYSACVVIETEDLTVGCDPWFTPGIFDGSWCQYPPLPRDPIDVIGKVDVLYISHIHPDHYDIRFLRSYLGRYPDTQIVIGETEPPYLLRKMRLDGLEPRVLDHGKFGETHLHIFANHARAQEGGEAIDTALVVRREDLSVVNLNDNGFDPEQVKEILAVCPGQRPTFALLPYSGAGPYPQTYAFETETAFEEAMARKKEQFLNLYSRYLRVLNPVKTMPFAGQYWLQGPLSALNGKRGISDATEACHRHKEVSLVLADGGEAFIDLKTLKASATREKPYDSRVIQSYLEALPFEGYDYEREICPIEERSIPLIALVRSAYARAIKGSRAKKSFWLCLKPQALGTYLAFDVSQDQGVQVLEDVSHLTARCEIFIDDRYLFGLLTQLYHWNNAAIGSQYRSKRVPDEFKREVYSFLDHFHV